MAVYLTQGLHRATQHTPQRIATVCGARRQTYRQLHERVARLAGALRSVGVERGDRVGILSLNSDRYLECYLAIFWLGAVVNAANTRWSAQELAYSFNDCGTKVLLIDDAHCALMDAIRAESRTLQEVVYLGDGPCPRVMLDYESLIAKNEPVDDVGAAGTDMAGVFYTGGTTGFPKGVMLSHENIVGASVNRLSVGYPVGPVYLHAAPIFHLAGALGLFSQLIAGGTHTFTPSFTAQSFMEMVERERVTDTLLVPTMIQSVLDHPEFEKHDLKSLRFMIYGASPISETLLDRTTAAFPGMALMQGFGMTELGGAVTFLMPEFHTPEGRARNKLRSAGRAAAMVEIRIVDDAGKEVNTGVVGEIAIRAMSTMLGYWGKPKETETALRDGWMHSGDCAYMDDEGFIYIVDRIKDMIVTGGENVYSAEVENALMKHPSVAACAVIGVPNDRWGEAVHAVLVLKPGLELKEADMVAHCKALIAGYKCPRTLELRDELPLSAAGKVLKNTLREPHWQHRARRVN